MYHTILFDLDGTLTASGEGITKSVQYALARMGRPEPDLKKLELFIGPPLTEQFMQYAGYDYATAKQATGYFQERYETVGLFENKPFPGVGRLLQGLRDSGRTLCVASSKPERFVRIILQHFGLDSYFAEMVGAHMDETGSHKDEVIGEALRRLGLTDHRAGTHHHGGGQIPRHRRCPPAGTAGHRRHLRVWHAGGAGSGPPLADR